MSDLDPEAEVAVEEHSIECTIECTTTVAPHGSQGKEVAQRRCSLQRRGAAMVEFAIVAPLLFFLFFAAFEFCRVAMIRHTVDNAVYEGCRQAIIPGATAGAARDKVETILGTLGVSGSTISVRPAMIDNRTSEITLTVEVSLDENTFVPPQLSGGNTITRSLTMRREGSDL